MSLANPNIPVLENNRTMDNSLRALIYVLMSRIEKTNGLEFVTDKERTTLARALLDGLDIDWHIGE